jgi:hypothetical protein
MGIGPGEGTGRRGAQFKGCKPSIEICNSGGSVVA